MFSQNVKSPEQWAGESELEQQELNQGFSERNAVTVLV